MNNKIHKQEEINLCFIIYFRSVCNFIIIIILFYSLDAYGRKYVDLDNCEKYNDLYSHYYDISLGVFYVGIHGELINIMPKKYISNDAIHILAIPCQADDIRIRLIIVENKTFRDYAYVNKNNDVIYSNDLIKEKFKDDLFYGIEKWPKYSNMEISSIHDEWIKNTFGYNNQYSEIYYNKKYSVPEMPDNCVAIAYALLGGNVYFGPSEVCSPSPLWLIRKSKDELLLISHNSTNSTILKICSLKNKAIIYFLCDKYFNSFNGVIKNTGHYPYYDMQTGVYPPTHECLIEYCDPNIGFLF